MPDRVMVEPGISVDTTNLLEQSKHTIVRSNSTIGRVNSVQIEGGWFYGYADRGAPEVTSLPGSRPSGH